MYFINLLNTPSCILIIVCISIYQVPKYWEHLWNTLVSFLTICYSKCLVFYLFIAPMGKKIHLWCWIEKKGWMMEYWEHLWNKCTVFYLFVASMSEKIPPLWCKVEKKKRTNDKELKILMKYTLIVRNTSYYNCPVFYLSLQRVRKYLYYELKKE